MNKALTLSLIIPAYNEEHHLKDCLDSVAAQTRQPDEVLVIDNNSSDSTAIIARKYPFVTILTEKNQGMIYARNTGFNAATSTLLGRIDADTVLPIDWVEKVHKFYTNEQNMDMALSGSGYFKNVRFPKIHSLFIDSFFITNSLLFGKTLVWGPNMVMPAHIWQHIKDKTCPENPAIYEDVDISLHLKEAGIKTSWMRSLRVGTRQKHLSNPLKMLQYILRLSGTLKHHSNWRWMPVFMSAIGIFVFEYPFLYALRMGDDE